MNYYLGFKIAGGEWRIVKKVATKEEAITTLRKMREHKLKAAAFIIKDGKYRKLVNI